MTKDVTTEGLRVDNKVTREDELWDVTEGIVDFIRSVGCYGEYLQVDDV